MKKLLDSGELGRAETKNPSQRCLASVSFSADDGERINAS